MATEELQTGALLNERYQITSPLGRGGMGTVYLAEHVRLNAPVAVKEIRGAFASDAEYQAALRQCEQEARTLVRLRHPNLPQVTDAFIENDRFYLVMEFIEGVTLEARLAERRGLPLPVSAVIEWGLQIADVLSYLHTLDPPLIFRDLKPSNVMLKPDGSIRLIDFGIARQFQPGAAKDTALLGSVGYSPPEQFGRNQTEPRSDIYALGATLHHLLTGRDPAATPFKFPPARSLNLAVPETLSRLISDCLEIDMEKRPASAHEVAMRLMPIRDAIRQSPQAAEIPLPGYGNTTGKSASDSLNAPDTIKAPMSSNPLPPLPSGAFGDSANRRALAPILIGSLIGLIMVILFAAGMMRLRPAKTSAVPAPPSAAAPIVETPTAPPAPPPSASAPSAPSAQNDAAPPPASNPTVEFTKIESPGLVPDAAGYLLQINVAGIVHSQGGKSGIVAAFFYDANDLPLIASSTGDKKYINSDGQLSVAAALSIAGDNAPFAVSLTIPIAQFPPAAMNAPLKIRSLVFFDGRRLAKSEPYSLPFLLHPVAAPPQNPRQQAPNPSRSERSDGYIPPFPAAPGRSGK